MKICIVSLNAVPYFSRASGGQFGGAEVQSAILAKAFAAMGADVRLVVANRGDGRGIPYPCFNAYDSDDGVAGLRFLHPRMTGLLRALERADADVYFQHCAGWVTGVAAWYCRRNRKTFVYFAGSDSDFSYRDAIIDGVRDKLLYFWGLKNASGIVVQNDYQAELCRLRLKKSPRVIPTAVEPAQTRDRTRDGGVVWAGGLRAVKRPEIFLDLAERLPDRRFALLGGELSTEPGFGRRIRARAERIPNVTAPGFVPAEEVARYLSTASALVNTSAFEGFPNAFLEAWARETPVISFVDVDGIVERHGAGAICGDFETMVETVREITGDDVRRKEMGERARRLVEATYGSSAAARAHLEFFEDLVHG